MITEIKITKNFLHIMEFCFNSKSNNILLMPFIFLALFFYIGSMNANNLNYDGKSGTINFGRQALRINETNFLLTHEKIDSPYIFNDALKAIEAINNSDEPNIKLYVTPSVYWLDNPDDPEVRYPAVKGGSTPYGAVINCDTLSIIGLTENPEDVVFAVNRGQTQGAMGNYTMLLFKGKSLQAENMTFGNYCNIDLIYPKDPSFNRKKRNEAIVQAQLGHCEGTDRLYARNCRFLSRLNLCPLSGARRSLYKDCYFECTDDALTGSAVYLDSKFTFYSGKPFYSTSKTGAIFLNCDIHSLVDGVQYLTKVPGMVTMIDTRFTSDKPIELKWAPQSSPIRCYQSNVTLNGEPVKIDANRSELGIDIRNSRLLQAYKIENNGEFIYNTPNLLGGNDGWDPLGILPYIKEIEKENGENLTSLPVALQIISSSRELAPKGDTLTLTVSPRLWGDYPIINEEQRDIKWEGPKSIYLDADGPYALVTSANHFPIEFKGIISAITSEGLVGSTNLKILPLLKEAPEFTLEPTLYRDKANVRVDYGLSSEGDDESFIVWYRSKDPSGINGIPVRHGYGKEGATYNLTSADHGYYIYASVAPKLSDTHQGQSVIIPYNEKVTQEMSDSSPEKELQLSTSFAEIPIVNGQLGKPGFWNFDSYKPADTYQHEWEADKKMSWYYGKGEDASTGIGLVQATRGARLSYTPTLTECKSMRISLVAEPCKGPGQGFGSATGQYMDICIKFDPLTLSGYALRIERTPDYDKAVTFTLIHYDNGKVTPVSKPVASNCFRNPCNISLEITEDSFSATASTEAPSVESNNPDVKAYVNLSAQVEMPTTNSSFTIQHTGTVGASATLLRNLNVTWD